METVINFLSALSGFVWGPVMLVLLIGVGLYLTVSLKFFTFFHIPLAFKNIMGGNKKGDGSGEISPFSALMTALAGTIGTGSIAGVATAIFWGGPGALFWMWITALVGMTTKFCEILLSVYYRKKTANGSYVGGSMFFIERGLGPKFKILSIMFCTFCILACFGTGNMIQSNTIAESLKGSFNISSEYTAVALFFIAGAVILGGVKRIGEFASKVVPFMAFLYIGISVTVFIMFYDKFFDVLAMIVEDAFTGTAVQGGFAGSTIMLAIRYGMARGVFSNEAGLGTAPIAHAASTNKCAVDQAIFGMLDTIITTIIVCSMTGFTIIITGMWTSPEQLNGATLAAASYSFAIPHGDKIVTVCLLFFAFTTILSWSLYGERCCIYLFGEKSIKYFRYIYVILVPLGAISQLDVIWLISDCANALMAIPNLIGILLLSPVILRLVEKYKKEGNVPSFDESEEMGHPHWKQVIHDHMPHLHHKQPIQKMQQIQQTQRID